MNRMGQYHKKKKKKKERKTKKGKQRNLLWAKEGFGIKTTSIRNLAVKRVLSSQEPTGLKAIGKES